MKPVTKLIDENMIVEKLKEIRDFALRTQRNPIVTNITDTLRVVFGKT